MYADIRLFDVDDDDDDVDIDIFLRLLNELLLAIRDSHVWHFEAYKKKKMMMIMMIMMMICIE